MVNYELPTSIEIDGKTYQITKNGDYRVILDIITALNDEELSEQERAIVALMIFYGELTHQPQEALAKIMKFIACGEENKNADNQPIMDWEQDFSLLIAPINNVLKTEIRSMEYLHWWTFISAYMEIGECTFSQVIGIRKKRQKGKPLDRQEQEFFHENADKIILKASFSKEDEEFLNEND